ncbi:CopG family ribbon-helix-helix protein [Pseudomonas fluorescens]|uniref:CopG family ribbon-helix-helix protein n=1 Tax=Pseudomonas fluorescens TaxID=294 RepID=UPI000AF61574|nr:Arc family DNA-binding protein [Pseudomonas fluorescens]
MSHTQFDSRTADKFVARLPDGLRAEIEAIATSSDRSMNSVFVQAVRQYLDNQNRQELLLEALAASVKKNRVNQTTDIPVVTDSMHIDDRVRMAANDRRYRHLRDRQRVEDADSDLLVLRGDTYYTGADLDREIDTALRLEQPMVQEQQP